MCVFVDYYTTCLIKLILTPFQSTQSQQNQAGKPRVQKFYTPYPPHKRLGVVQRIFELVRERPDTLCNFIEIPLNEFEDNDDEVEAARQRKRRRAAAAIKQQQESDGAMVNVDEDEEKEEEVLRVIYRHYATLYFVFCVDEAESELGILDLIQVSPHAYQDIISTRADFSPIYNIGLRRIARQMF